jgi:hypothetical protein
MAGRCRYGDLEFTAALLGGHEPALVRCDETAAYTVIVGTDADGFVVEVTTPVCPVHEAFLVHNPGYQRSIKLRDHTTT